MKDKDAILSAIRTLRIPSEASIHDIKAIYKKLAMKYHPDRNDSSSNGKMAEINAAYRTIMDYCQNYAIPFDENCIRLTEKEWWVKHFGDNM